MCVDFSNILHDLWKEQNNINYLETMYISKVINTNESECKENWNNIIWVIYMKTYYDKPWKLTNVQAKNPEFEVNPEDFYHFVCI
jgi:hypothetical protein